MKKKILAIAQLAFGIALVVFLLRGIDRNYTQVEFTVADATVAGGAVYAAAGGLAPDTFIVLDGPPVAGRLRTLLAHKLKAPLPANGTLTLKSGEGPATLAWTAVATAPHGLKLLGASFAVAARHGGWLAAALALCFACLACCTLRWRVLLQAQGMEVPFWKALALYFIGHYFNAFMPGSVGGDLVKAYYVAREVHHRRTEAATTVFVDRLMGLLALVLLCAVVMVLRLRFFLAYPETRAALVFNAALLVGAVGGLFLVFRRNLFEHWAFFRRLEERTSLGRILARVYGACQQCLVNRRVLALTMVYSLANHLMLVLCAWALGHALEIPLRLKAYITVVPIINAIAAIPATPGGLGTREVASKFLLGVVGVPEVKAVPLSLLLYSTLLVWSVVGGLVYLVYANRRGKAPVAVIAAETEAAEETPA